MAEADCLAKRRSFGTGLREVPKTSPTAYAFTHRPHGFYSSAAMCALSSESCHLRVLSIRVRNEKRSCLSQSKEFRSFISKKLQFANMNGFYLSRRLGLLLALCAASTSGCTTASVAQNSGAPIWKTGRVHSIVQGKDLTNIQDRECVAMLTSIEIERSRFAVVRYSRGRGGQNRTVQIPESSELKVGDCVRVNLTDCEQPLELLPQSAGLCLR